MDYRNYMTGFPGMGLFRKRSLPAPVVLILMICAASLISCGGGRSSSISAQDTETGTKYARLLRISEYEDHSEVTVVNPWDTLKILQRYILVPKDSVLPDNLPSGKIIRTPVSNALVYSTVHVGLLDELGVADAIGGICGAEYVNDSIVGKRLLEGSLVDCGYSQNPDIESIIKLNPEIIMVSPYENNDQYAKVSQLGIPMIECADYLEKTALGRAEWEKFYGLLFGREEKAEEMFLKSETEYLDLKKRASEAGNRPSVIIDQRYGQVWYVPAATSLMTELINDAGGSNPFAGYDNKETVALAPERVLAEAHDADVWLLRYNQDKEKTLEELAKDSPVNGHFKAFKEGNVYGCNTRYVNFFEETPFHPELLLRDMIAVIHPELVGMDSLPVYYRKLK